MTTATSRTRFDALGSARDPARLLAMAAGLVLVGTVLTVFYHVTTIVGGTGWLTLYVVLALALATLLARTLSTRAGLALTGALLVAGLAGYVLLLPAAYYRLFSVGAVVNDLRAWLAGRSVLLLLQADLWAVSVAPAPVFATWYLTLRRRYDWAAVAGGLALAFFVLTGDADRATTVAGAVAVLGLLGFGSLDRRDGTSGQIQQLGLLLAVVVVLARTVGLVPGRASAGGSGGGGSGGGASLEGTLIGGRRLFVRGSVSLSPTVRYTVTADRAAYWQDATFGRYTGRGWIQAGGSSPWSGPLAAPPGPGVSVQQQFDVAAESGAMPAAWKPVLLDPDASSFARVTRTGSLQPSRPLQSGESYTVISQVPDWSAADLRAVDSAYPDDVVQQFTQLPDSVPDRVGERATAIVEAAEADTAFDEALAIQGWLARNKEYSLSVRRRGWDAADAFIFQMQAGYCVHFATAMAVMLRTRGVPARVAVGYAPGEQVAENRWVVRGFDSHAWVEVYFPEFGWIPFDPTPADPRRGARQQRLEAARSAGEGAVDTDESVAPTPSTPEPTPTPTGVVATPGTQSGQDLEDRILEDEPGSVPETITPPNVTATETAPGAIQSGGSNATGGDVGDAVGGGGRGVGDRDRLSLLAAAAGLLIGAHQFGVVQRVVDEVRLRWQPATGSPRRDVARAFDRLEYYLQRNYRPRGEGETPRQYVDSIEGLDARGRVRRVAEIYERSRYAGEESRKAADEAIRLVNDVVRNER